MWITKIKPYIEFSVVFFILIFFLIACNKILLNGGISQIAILINTGVMIYWFVKKFGDYQWAFVFSIMLFIPMELLNQFDTKLFKGVAHVQTIKQAILNQTTDFFTIDQINLNEKLMQYNSEEHGGKGGHRAIFYANYPIYIDDESLHVARLEMTIRQGLGLYPRASDFGKYTKKYKKIFLSKKFPAILVVERSHKRHESETITPSFIAHFDSFESLMIEDLKMVLLFLFLSLMMGYASINSFYQEILQREEVKKYKPVWERY